MDVPDIDLPSHEDVRTVVRSLFLGAIRVTLEMLLEEEVRELAGVGRWQKPLARKDRLNESYLRGPMTSMGHLDLAVPRTRASGSAGEVLGRYKRRSAEVDDAITSAYVQGVSALVAYGVGDDGHRQLPAITIGPSESQASWADLLRQLLERGLSGVRLVTADGHAGLAAAARQALPEAKLQRFTVHLTRNVLAKALWRLRGRLGRETSAIFEAATPKDARARLDALVAGLGKQVPGAMGCLTEGFAAATQFFAFPKAHWKRLRSTNGLERLHGEVKRRIRSVGAFPDRASSLRLFTAVALQGTGIWDDRRYLAMSSLYPPAAKAA
ncbi:MAG: IS256 family transposase [Deltaproteobacteria bacterium]|nr:IS256 family transposase [Deltaproteobacteria bacterium]